MTNDSIAASLDGGAFSLARQTDHILSELRNLLQRAASALEAPDHLNGHERSQLIEELFAATLDEEAWGMPPSSADGLRLLGS